MRLFRNIGVVGAMLLACAIDAGAQTFPSRAVRIVVPYPPGAITDTLPRLVADKLREEWNQPVVVENRPGAGGRIGTEAVAKSAADGYTLVIGIPDTIAIAPFLVRNLTYDPTRDLAPITMLARQSYILVTRQDLPGATLAEVVRAAKANPGRMRYGSWGNGSAGHLAMKMLEASAGFEMEHVPYKGSSAALLGLLGGEIDVMFAGYSSTLSQIRAGKVRVMARTSARRLALAPDIPTVAELGFPGYEVQAWYGLFAPAQTPPAVIDQIHRATVRALSQPDVRGRVDTFFAETVGNSPEEFARAIREEQARWSGLLSTLKISID